MLRIIAFIILNGLFLSVFAQKDFEFLREKENIVMYQRDFGTKGIKQFKLTTTFKQTKLSSIFAVFRDHATFTDWMEGIKVIKNVKKVSETENFDYYDIGFPWPLKNRDAVYHQQIYQDAADRSLNVNFSCLPTFVPYVEDKVRLTEIQGAWKFIPHKNGDIEVIYINYSDPINIPSSFVNLIFSDALYNTLYRLRKQVKKEKYQHKKYSFIQD